jgi:hypothetical protein
MKVLIVIGAYPNTTKKEEVLKQEIESLKSLGFDFMIVSHYPVSVELQNMIDYYIYDKNQTLTPKDRSPYYWFNTESFHIKVFNSRHSLPICQNMFNSFKFSEIKNYDFVFFVENDNIFTPNDVNKFNTLLNEMVSKNKQCIFFKPESFRQDNSYVYETQLFGISPKYLNEKFVIPTTENEWYETSMSHTLELAFYNKLKHLEDDFLIIDVHSSEYFNESQINIFRVESFIFELLYNVHNPSYPVLYCHNNTLKGEIKKILVEFNGDVIEDKIMLPSHWFYREFTLGNTLKLTVFDIDGSIDYIKTYELTENNLEKIKDKGIIEIN